MDTAQTTEQKEANKQKHELISVQLNGQIFSNYIAIIYNKKFLLMPSTFTQIASNSNEQIDAYGNYYDIQKIISQNNNVYLSFPTTTVQLRQKMYLFRDQITCNAEERTLRKAKGLFYAFSLMSLSLCCSLYTQNDNTYAIGSVITSSALALSCATFVSLFNDTLINSQKTEASMLDKKEYKDVIDIGKHDEILSKICFYTEQKKLNLSYEMKTHIVLDKEYKIILPRSIKERYGLGNGISIMVSVSCGDKTISQFINTRIEFNDRITGCAWLSLGSVIGSTIRNGEIDYLFANESFPLICTSPNIVRNSGNPDLLLNLLPDPAENSAEQIFTKGKIHEIERVVSLIP